MNVTAEKKQVINSTTSSRTILCFFLKIYTNYGVREKEIEREREQERKKMNDICLVSLKMSEMVHMPFQ